MSEKDREREREKIAGAAPVVSRDAAHSPLFRRERESEHAERRRRELTRAARSYVRISFRESGDDTVTSSTTTVTVTVTVTVNVTVILTIVIVAVVVAVNVAVTSVSLPAFFSFLPFSPLITRRDYREYINPQCLRLARLKRCERHNDIRLIKDTTRYISFEYFRKTKNKVNC